MVGVTDGRMAVPRSELPPRPGILYMNGPAALGGFAATIRLSGNMRWQNAKIERWGETCPVDSHYLSICWSARNLGTSLKPMVKSIDQVTGTFHNAAGVVVPAVDTTSMHVFTPSDGRLRTVSHGRIKVRSGRHSHVRCSHGPLIDVDGMMRRECESCLERDEVSVSA